MIPKHCREVSVRRVSFPLTEDEIKKRFTGKRAYVRTSYIILNNGDEWAVTRIEKTDGFELFRKIKKIEIVSLPENTGYVEDSNVGVLNPSAMMNVAEEVGKETVVIKGEFEHVSFVHDEKRTPLTIYDAAPPHPPKLVRLVERALGLGRIKKPMKIVPDILDLNKLAQESTTPFVMFPCYASGLKCEKTALYLDQAPDLSSIKENDVTLIGCDLSLQTFTSLYGKTPVFVNMCPQEKMAEGEFQGIGVARCCAIKEGHERMGDIAYVSWGATVSEVEAAIRDLLDACAEGESRRQGRQV